jgi:hypothetical protein
LQLLEVSFELIHKGQGRGRQLRRQREIRMGLRRKLFRVWCVFAALWLLFGILGNTNLILLKLQVGSWRAAYVHVVVTSLFFVGVPVAVLLMGRIILWVAESRKPASRNIKTGH